MNDKSVDGVVGTRTLGGRMVGADKSTELWLGCFYIFSLRCLIDQMI